MTHFRLIIPILLASCLVPLTAGARKIQNRLPVPKKAEDQPEMTKGSQAISTECPECGDGYTLSDIVFSGYDKKASADKESFFISNKSDRLLTGVSLYITYFTTDSLQLHRRWLNIRCHIAPGETGKVDVSSWDTQKSFFYTRSEAPRRRSATPYIVKFEPVTIYLRYK